MMLVEAYKSFMDFLPFEYWTGVLFWIKIVAAVINVLLLGIIIFCLRRSNYIKFKYGFDMADFFRKKPVVRGEIEKNWAEVVKKIASFNDSDWKLAILEADKIVDGMITEMGGKGSTFGERLENLSSGAIKNIDVLVQAHKVRNNIVHDPDYKISHEVAKEVIGYYERVLQEVHAL